MNAKCPYENTGHASAGTMSEMCTGVAVVLLCAVLITLTLTAAFLLLTLPEALDAVAATVSAPPASTDR